MKLKQSVRARGANRGGTGGGGGYEQTDPDWAIKRLDRIVAEYNELQGMWKETYMRQLDIEDRKALNRRLHPERYGR